MDLAVWPGLLGARVTVVDPRYLDPPGPFLAAIVAVMTYPNSADSLRVMVVADEGFFRSVDLTTVTLLNKIEQG